MASVPVAAAIMVPIAVVMIIMELRMPIFPRAIISASVFHFAPGCCHQQTGQAE
jgi:hypothetical protein